TKYLMWRDLVDRADLLKRNPVVRHLIDTPKHSYGDGAPFPEPQRLDPCTRDHMVDQRRRLEAGIGDPPETGHSAWRPLPPYSFTPAHLGSRRFLNRRRAVGSKAA
ncbi:hypothetical protein MKK88_03265, partial [Methylobacterium sp. E-005]|uniref:hypothetical protein n=1 Tax=Methylobacterium sp. E-005 TaxID=2836549 RepID=UPI001FBACB67